MPAAAVTSEHDTSRGLTLSFPFSKVDRERREVWGLATSEAIDQQGEIVDFEASKKAFGEWTEKIDRATQGRSMGNVREMHQPKAVGRLIAWKPDDDRKGIWVGAKISESQDGQDAWKKIGEGVLNGFSIGAPTAERVFEIKGDRPVRRVVSYHLSEISLVDNPACPDAFFSEIKLARGGKEDVFVMTNQSVLKAFDPSDEPGPRGEDRLVKQEGRHPTTIQTLILSREKFKSAEDAKAWAREHEFKTPAADETEDSRRLRQRDPGDFEDGSFRTVRLGEGVSAVIGHLKGGKASSAEADLLMKVLWDRANEEAAMIKETRSATGTSAVGTVIAPSTEDLEKAGKKIGPHTRPTGKSPGVETPSVQTPPDPPKPAKSADATAGGDAPADTEEVKDCPEHGAECPGHEDPDMGKDSGMRYGYCALCGAKLAEAEAGIPTHKECREKTAAAPAKVVKIEMVASATDGGMAKAFEAAITPLVKSVNENFAALGKRVDTLEKQPMPGGPHRTELPPGVRPVEKGGAAGAPAGEDETALEKAIRFVEDPFTRDRLQQQLAKAAIRRAQSRPA